MPFIYETAHVISACGARGRLYNPVFYPDTRGLEQLFKPFFIHPFPFDNPGLTDLLMK
jgi:hypothetical protein